MSNHRALFLAAVTLASSASACTLDAVGGPAGETAAAPFAAPARVIKLQAIAADTAAITGSISGLSGDGLALELNGQTLRFDVSGPFSIEGLPRGSSYRITVAAQPIAPWQLCKVENGEGVAGSALDVQITCGTRHFHVGGVVQGLTGGQLVLRRRDDDVVGIEQNGAFTFPRTMPSGANYDVVIHAQPEGHTCTLEGEGSVAGEDVHLSVLCARDEDG